LAAYRAANHVDWRYQAIEMVGEDLPAFVAGLDAAGGGAEWMGLSLTMPCKEAGLRLADWVDPVALRTGAVNTLVPRDGSASPRTWAGFNTDVGGITAALAEAGVASASRVAVLGAGATARSAVAAAAAMGAERIEVYARRPEAAAEVAALASGFGCVGVPLTWARAAECVTADVVVSTVPAGVADSLASAVADIPSQAALLDVVYQPWPTALASSWTSPLVVAGLSMLLWQAVAQVRLMTGLDPDVAAMKAAVGL
jgi:shikimate dehydrogenase